MFKISIKFYIIFICYYLNKYIDNKLTAPLLTRNEMYFICILIKPNREEKTLMKRSAVHFEVIKVVSCK